METDKGSWVVLDQKAEHPILGIGSDSGLGLVSESIKGSRLLCWVSARGAGPHGEKETFCPQSPISQASLSRGCDH